MANDHDQPAQLLQSAGKHRLGSGPARPVRDFLAHRARLIALAVCLSVIVAGVTVAAFSAGAHRARNIGAPSPQASYVQPSTQGQSGNVTAGQPGAVASGASSSTHTGPGQQRKIARWSSGPGGKALAAVKRQLGTAMQAAGIKLYGTMKQACVSLVSDVGAAKAGPPLPDGGRQRAYTSALAGLSRAAADCRAAISIQVSEESVRTRVNSNLLLRTRAEFAAMASKLYWATADM